MPNASDLELFSPALDGRPSASASASATASCAATSARWARPTTSRRWSTPRRCVGGRDLRAARRRQAARRARAGAAPRQRALPRPECPTRPSVARLAAASDACLTIFKDVPVLATNSPNKLFDTFAAGRAGDREQRRLDARAGGGERGRACSCGPATRATWPRRWPGCATTPSEAERLGRNARALAEREFDRDALAGPGARACSRRRRADRALLLRGQHQRARAPARLPRRDRAHPPGRRGARGAGARQRLRRRLGRGGARLAAATCG